MNRLARWSTPLVALALACASGAALAADHLDVRLSLASPVVRGDVDVKVDVLVTNTTGHAVDVLRWQLPTERLQGPLFRITREDGSPVPYVGPLVKRVAPRAQDKVHLEAGESRSFSAELSGGYELGNGRYAIEYLARGRHGDEAVVESAAPIYLWTEGRSALHDTNLDEEWLVGRAATAA